MIVHMKNLKRIKYLEETNSNLRGMLEKVLSLRGEGVSVPEELFNEIRETLVENIDG